MAILGIDLGGTKVAVAVFTESGVILEKEVLKLNNRKGTEVGNFITGFAQKYLEKFVDSPIRAVGISVPGISRIRTGTVWAPNIPGWDDYPLLQEMESICGNIPVNINSDRACYILGELWKGKAKGCKDAIFLAVGTGIGAGILVDGNVLQGSQDIAGSIGWMALDRPFNKKYLSCGFFEYYASGEGIARAAREMIASQKNYMGELKNIDREILNAADIFMAFEKNDAIAVAVIQQSIQFWGMAVANLISLFNPEKIIFGGGVFGPGENFLLAIRDEAQKWAQPISFSQVKLEISGMEGDAGIYGAGFMALQNVKQV